MMIKAIQCDMQDCISLWKYASFGICSAVGYRILKATMQKSCDIIIYAVQFDIYITEYLTEIAGNISYASCTHRE